MQTPSRRVRTRLSLVVPALVMVPLLGGCGFGAQTDAVYQPAVGVNTRPGQVDVLGGVVVSSTPGSGRLLFTLSNESETDGDSLRVLHAMQLECPGGEGLDREDIFVHSRGGRGNPHEV